MKENWTYKKLGEVCEILNGFAFKSDEYEDNGIRVMRITNVQKGEIVDDDPKFFPLKRKDEITKYILREGDVLMSLTGNVGRVGIMEERFLPAALNQRVACLRLIDNEIDKRYLFHILNSDTFKNDCVFNAAGIAQKNMSTRWLEQYKIPVPPIETQSRIVSELDLLQSIIDKQKTQLRELDNLAQAVFYDMFGDPVENDKGWEVKKLGEVASFKNGLNYSPNETGERYYIIGVSDFQNKSEINCDEALVSICLNDKINGEYLLRDDDILFVRSNGNKQLIARNILVKTNNLKVTFSGFCIRARIIKNVVSALFINCLLKLPQSHKALTMKGRGCNISNLNQTTLNDFEIILPPLSLQQSFAAKIDSIEKQKAAITQSIAETQRLFDYTMDKYFG